jgi:hypothetical protein
VKEQKRVDCDQPTLISDHHYPAVRFAALTTAATSITVILATSAAAVSTATTIFNRLCLPHKAALSNTLSKTKRYKRQDCSKQPRGETLATKS